MQQPACICEPLPLYEGGERCEKSRFSGDEMLWIEAGLGARLSQILQPAEQEDLVAIEWHQLGMPLHADDRRSVVDSMPCTTPNSSRALTVRPTPIRSTDWVMQGIHTLDVTGQDPCEKRALLKGDPFFGQYGPHPGASS